MDKIADDAQHLLVVDDDKRIRLLLSKFLTQNGYRVSTAASGFEARVLLQALIFDLLVLDVMMPGENGFELAEFVRSSSQVPILMLTARSEIDNRIKGLEIGADDYLAKPFEPRELLLRIASILRRGALVPPVVVQQVTFGDYCFSLLHGDLTCGGEPVRLTDRERDILCLLAATPGETVPRYKLIASDESGDRAVDVLINRLRRKIEADPSQPQYLQTVRGIGYRLMGVP